MGSEPTSTSVRYWLADHTVLVPKDAACMAQGAILASHLHTSDDTNIHSVYIHILHMSYEPIIFDTIWIIYDYICVIYTSLTQ